jgi:hypothetical protein
MWLAYMGAPHNPSRYGETWPQHRIEACLAELEAIRPWVILSGGWAWHFMSPKGHVELKHAHDHKDIDVFVFPNDVAAVMGAIQERGFSKSWTKYDRLPSDESFRRYEKSVEFSCKMVRVTIDFFVRGDVPRRIARSTAGGWWSRGSSSRCIRVSIPATSASPCGLRRN